MADYFTNFSVIMPLNKEQQEYAVEIANDILDILLKSLGMILNLEFKLNKSIIHVNILGSQENNIENVVDDFVTFFIAGIRLNCIGLNWNS